MKKYYGSIFFIALATLALEVAIIRYFSIALWSNYGYMVISIALFGMGVSGTVLTMARDWFERHLNKAMYGISLAIVPITVIAYILMKIVPFNALQIIDSNYTLTQMGNLSLYFLILFFPFFLSGMLIGLAFLAHKRTVEKLYFYDLIGAGTGTLLLLIFMFLLHPKFLFVPIVIFFFCGHVLTIDLKNSFKTKLAKVISSGVIFAFSFVLILLNSKINYSPQKDIRHTMSSINAEILNEDYSPLGLLQIVKSTKERSAPGLSGMAYQMFGKMPEFRGVYSDGDQSSSIMGRLDGNTIDAIRFLPQIAPFLIKKKPAVLIMGMGGGRSLSVAYHSVHSLNFLKTLKEVWTEEKLKEKIKALRTQYRNPAPKIFKRLLDANKPRLEKEVNEEWKKVIADEVNRNSKLQKYFNIAFERSVSNTENTGPSQIDALELNGQLINVLKNKLSPFNGGLLHKPGISVYQTDIRGYIRRTKKRYDLIEMSLYLGGGMSTSGNLPSHENYLYTTHSIKDTFEILKKNGILSITIDAKENVRDALRLFTTIMKALENERNMDKKIFIFRSMTTATFLIKKGEFKADEIKKLKTFCESNSFDVSYYNGIDPTGNRQVFNEETSSSATGEENSNPERYALYKISIAKFLNQNYEKYIDNFPYNIRPVSDNQPYFAYKLKSGQTLKALFTGNFSSVPYQETNYLILWLNLAIAIIVAVLIICLPLVKTIFNRRKRTDWYGGKLKMIGYFACLGFGFLFVEIVLIQKFVLFLTNPIYSTSLVLAAILVFSGCGSFYSSKLVEKFRDPNKVMLLAAIVIGSVVFLYILILDPILRSLMSLPMILKFIISIIFIAPVAFFLGMPFPLGLSEVNTKREDFMPWAWGINGATSVISTVLTTILSISLGFHIVWIIAIAVYAGAYFLFPGRLSY